MFRVGQEIGSYTLIRKLGRGGFGEVWLAEHRTKYATTQVAVKLPLDEQVDHAAIEHEARLWAKASGHSNILPIIEANEYDGQVVIVSEYAPGGSLEEWLRANGKMPVEKAAKMTIQILDGLEFLHLKNIIHRDIKPANILLQGNTPRLADFGISRAMNTASMSATISGTEAYMAPEAFDGNRNVQTDVWSVGVVLYQLISGNLPFPQQNIAERIFAVLTSKFVLLSEEIPEYLREIVQKSLAKLPENRYQTAKEMREDLEMKHLSRNHPLFVPPDDLKYPDGRVKIPEYPMAVPVGGHIADGFRGGSSWNIYASYHSQEIVIAFYESCFGPAKRDLDSGTTTWKFDDNFSSFKGYKSISVYSESALTSFSKNHMISEVPENTKAIISINSSHWKDVDSTPIDFSPPKIPPAETVTQHNPIAAGGDKDVSIVTAIHAQDTESFTKNLPIAAFEAANKTNKRKVNLMFYVGAAVLTLSLLLGIIGIKVLLLNPILKNSIGMEFVKVPAGSFMMGSNNGDPDEKPVHKVTISKNFYLGKYEVTQAQWKAVMNNNPSYFKGDNLPVEQVSWLDVQEFIKKLNIKGEGTYRLPTEAEWEYAASGGRDGDYFGIGDGANLSSQQANFDGNYPFGNAVKGIYLARTTNVGSYQPNGFGLYDMQGNVGEWCQDWFGVYSSEIETDPTGASSASIRVLRGGSWTGHAATLRVASRSASTPSDQGSVFGFRLLRFN